MLLAVLLAALAVGTGWREPVRRTRQLPAARRRPSLATSLLLHLEQEFWNRRFQAGVCTTLLEGGPLRTVPSANDVSVY